MGNGNSGKRLITFWFLAVAFPVFVAGCSALPLPAGKKAEVEIDPKIRAEVKEALKDAPKDELSKSYDPLSLLKKAEEFYQKNNYLEAAAEYEYFLSLHPLHRWAAYAQYRLGLCYFHQIRTVDRDIEPVLKAMAAFQKLVDLHPDSPFVEGSLKKIRTSKDHLAQHEFYIGIFYYKKSAYPAAIARFSGILDQYPDSKVAGNALYHLALSHQAAGDAERAKKELKELLDRYPQSEYRREAKRLLSRLNGKET